MRKKLLLMLAVSPLCFSFPSSGLLYEREGATNHTSPVTAEVMALLDPTNHYSYPEIKTMLHREGQTLNGAVITKVLTAIKCAQKHYVGHNNILTVIDYSLPSNQKRLWVFDLKEKKLLFHTYVSHGIKSGKLLSNNFSNKNNSKASSIGIYKTENAYYGRYGLSLKLYGLDKGFNDNAANRAVVMHSGWYVDEHFIKKYGRAGRSWGCPALPPDLTAPIINTIKENALFVAFYPSDNWFLKSKFLNCNNFSLLNINRLQIEEQQSAEESREEILFADINKNNKREENEPIVVITAEDYERIFHTKAPLTRMLRRQINNIEYIALSNGEFEEIINQRKNTENSDTDLNRIYFVIPVVKMLRGYYATEMKIMSLGKIKGVESHVNATTQEDKKSYTVYFESNPLINLKSTNHFIRWLGL
ncbi:MULTISPECIES: murein L,D-transpeptidase catalytic domain family protein [unclassified Legionella]|uniref:murein L,D-transpeptidase catalytic domain family protein n=1 Tax=unclassified Legionella TaxID=2622702 RepID=UPI001054FB19|nr:MULTISPECIES: murein L,D-transpeptidase catalytic domain family protein [unclassified Legionella]MDI9817812.1 murein L,D-transpeptidase catalytic domain family protein [Legionella sp. PL877]